ncbi:MAG: SDR family oxidoreductase [Anaerolineae bacterium]
MIPIDLSGKTALVTGGGQGLGAATSLALSRAGASVVINYFEEGEGANRLRAEETVSQLPCPAVALQADVRDGEQVRLLVNEAVERYGSLDIVINNAAILRDRTLKRMSDDDWHAVIDTNLTGVFNVCRACTQVLAEGGRIVNLASISAIVGFFGQTNYAAAKAGVIGLTKVLAKELARRNITVNAVAPGVVLTDMGRSIPEDVRAEMIKSVPLGRFGEPEEIANVILFLCSDLASYVTGQIIQVNGGWAG